MTLEDEIEELRRVIGTRVVHRLCTTCGADFMEAHERFCDVLLLLARLEKLESTLASRTDSVVP